MSPRRSAPESRSWRTLPNLVTALRILLIVPFVYYAVRGRDLWALSVFVIAGGSDAIDGLLARWLNQTSQLGRLVDPLADKALTGIAYIVLSLFRDGYSAIPAWVMAVVVARDVLILLGCWMVYRLAHNAGFQPSVLGKLNTLIELSVIAVFLSMARFPSLASLLPLLYVVMTVSVVVSFTGYVRQGMRMIRVARQQPERA